MSPIDPVLPARPPLSPEAEFPAQTLTRIDRYELIYRLGTGGMGNVYLARRRNESGLQRLFAVKAMHALLSADADFANMFLDEAHIASKLHHGNVVGIVDLGCAAGRLYMVMDYVEGPTLAQLMTASIDHPPALICAVVIDLLHGLHAAHCLTNEKGEQLDLVHRDVSPSNILVGIDGVARLTDFGIAKARTRRTSTSPGVRKGKLSYSAPEQITNPGAEDARVDVFASGVVLWNALTGKRLFEGDNEAAVILKVVTSEIPEPSTVGLRPPPCLDEVCLRALSRDPAGRYASAAEMADDLRRVTRENDLVAGPEQVAAWVGKVFGEERERRREAIRRMSSVPDEPRSAASFPRGTDPQRRELESAYTELSLSWTQGGTPAPLRQPRRWSWALRGVAVAVLAAGALTALYLAFRDEAPAESVSDAARASQGAQLPSTLSGPAVQTSTPMPTTTARPDALLTSSAADPAPPAPTSHEPTSHEPTSHELTSQEPASAEALRFDRRDRRDGSSKPASRRRNVQRAASEGSAPPPESPAAAPAVTPASSPAAPAAEPIERNPYLRHSAPDR